MKPKIGEFVYLKYNHRGYGNPSRYILKVTKVIKGETKWRIRGVILWSDKQSNHRGVGYDNTYEDTCYCAYDECSIYRADTPIMSILFMEAL